MLLCIEAKHCTMAIYKHSIFIQVAMFLVLKIQCINNREFYVKVKKENKKKIIRNMFLSFSSCVHFTNRKMLGLKVTFYERYRYTIDNRHVI